jgi:hypothetical protein
MTGSFAAQLRDKAEEVRTAIEAIEDADFLQAIEIVAALWERMSQLEDRIATELGHRARPLLAPPRRSVHQQQSTSPKQHKSHKADVGDQQYQTRPTREVSGRQRQQDGQSRRPKHREQGGPKERSIADH